MAELSLHSNDYKVLAQNIKIGPWGGKGVSSFDFGQSSSRIIKVELHSGVVVDGLKITYAVGRDIVTTYKAGGPGGKLHKFELRDGEYINSMVGEFGPFNGETCITLLNFTTNFGKIYGPFGKGGGTKFSVPTIDGHIVGFFGQFTKYIDEIGVYMASN